MSGIVGGAGTKSGLIGGTEVIFSGYLTTAVTSSGVILQWTENEDSDNAMASGVFTVPIAGIYQIITSVSILTTPQYANYAGRADIQIDNTVVSSTALLGYKMSSTRELDGTAVYTKQLALNAEIKIESYFAGTAHTIYTGPKTTLSIIRMG